MTRRIRRNYTDEFKQQMISLYNSGKPRSEIIKEYDLTPSTFSKWIQQFENSGSFKVKDNLSEEEKQLITLEKENKQLRMVYLSTQFGSTYQLKMGPLKPKIWHYITARFFSFNQAIVSSIR